MVQPSAVESAIQRAIPDATVTVEDLTGGGDHLQVSVVSSAFSGLSRIRQHQMVYGCLLYTSPSPRDATLSRMPSSA